MAVICCERGHFYDDAKYPACPHCKTEKQNRDGPDARPGDPATELHGFAQNGMVKKRLMEFVQATQPREEKTISLFSAKGNLHPVVGWLICVQGDEMGRDYRLHAGRNFIGRSLTMDISLPDDPTIHRENHCSIIYEPRERRFILVAGDGEPPFLNGAMVSHSHPLHARDRIEIGKLAFCFMPFCGEDFTW